jgi:hypothetical protein
VATVQGGAVVRVSGLGEARGDKAGDKGWVGGGGQRRDDKPPLGTRKYPCRESDRACNLYSLVGPRTLGQYISLLHIVR